MKNIAFGLLLLFSIPNSTKAQFTVSLESGLAFSGYNDVRVPNGPENNGTLFSLRDDFRPESPTPFLRIEAAYLLNKKHTFELTAAPLILEYSGAQRDNIDFSGSVFGQNSTDGRYEFNTYRGSYQYRLVNNSSFLLDLGATVLVRDARIALTQNNSTADDTDLGVVPLVSFRLDYRPADQLSLLLKGDALVGPEGRAEDIFVGMVYRFKSEGLGLKLGYRIIEGGADVDQVYNFALIHFADVGLQYQF